LGDGEGCCPGGNVTALVGSAMKVPPGFVMKPPLPGGPT
jgi:hypothetical protein